MEELIFKIKDFEGPLDLLVYLVKQKKMDIREISISELADDFMKYMEEMKELNIQLSAEFISTASYLMELKSKALLPKIMPEEKEKFEREKENFYSTIESYAKIKEIAREIAFKDIKERFPVRIYRSFGTIDKKLSKILPRIINNLKLKEKVYRIKTEEITVEEMIEKLLNKSYPSTVERLLKGARTRYELVVILLAILELIRMGKISYSEGVLIRN
ncbi:MAG: segregation/condensation protein A [Thermotogaceae bacterium]|nr:segregation/condensation protein A [Thermotogaceae bacterium]